MKDCSRISIVNSSCRLFSPNKALSSDFELVHYLNNEDTTKNQITFSYNVLSFLLNGYKEIYHAQNPVKISTGQFALITSPNCLMTEKRKQKNQDYSSILFLFSNKMLDEFKLKYKKLIRKTTTKNPCDILVFPHDDYSNNSTKSLGNLINSQQSTPELLQIKFDEIMLYLLKNNPEKMNALLSKESQNNEVKFKHLIESNLNAGLKLEELAFLCNMSLSTFKRYFYEYYKTSPQKYIRKRRMEMIQFLLEKGEKPMAFFDKVGYKTLSGFAKAHKEHFGMSARQFAKK